MNNKNDNINEILKKITSEENQKEDVNSTNENQIKENVYKHLTQQHKINELNDVKEL